MLSFASALLLLSASALAAGKPAPKGAAAPGSVSISKAGSTSAQRAGSTKINGVTYTGKGNVAPLAGRSELPAEQSLRLKKVFLFPSIDDLSGALAPKLDDKLAELFSHNTRFELVRDPQVVKALSPDDSAYSKAALSPEVHKEAAKVTGADTTVLLRTRNVGTDTRMTLELRDGHGGLLFSEEGSVPGSAKMEERSKLIEQLYRGVLTRLPFEGTVTGRTAGTVTVDLGTGSMRPNEVIEIARIVSVQRHPLLGTVIGTDYVRTGRARVATVDRVLSFAEVIEEFPGEKVEPGQKVLRQQAALVHRGAGAEPTPERADKPRPGRRSFNEEERADDKKEDSFDERLKSEIDQRRARYGKGEVDLYYGSLTHVQTLNGTESPFGGSGIGGSLGGELWITKNWILAGEYGFQNATLVGSDAASGTAIGSTSWSAFELRPGFRIFPSQIGDGIALTASGGYQRMRFDIPANSAAAVGGRTFSGIVLRIDGDMKFLERQVLSAGFGIAPFSHVTEAAAGLGTPNKGTVVGLNLSWSFQLVDQLFARVGMRYDVASTSFEGTTSSVSDKRFAIGPGLYYLF